MSECRTAKGLPKFRFRSRAEANLKAKAFPAEDMKAYKCKVCGWFHLGHYPADEKARAGMRERHRNPPG
jgi:hypothetical protein